MGSMIPKHAAIAVSDPRGQLRQRPAGMQVLILAVHDGSYGGINLVDEDAVAWVQAAVQQRGADAYVLWTDTPVRPTVHWGDGADPGKAWRVPRVVRNAILGADVLISYAWTSPMRKSCGRSRRSWRSATFPWPATWPPRRRCSPATGA